MRSFLFYLVVCSFFASTSLASQMDPHTVRLSRSLLEKVQPVPAARLRDGKRRIVVWDATGDLCKANFHFSDGNIDATKSSRDFKATSAAFKTITLHLDQGCPNFLSVSRCHAGCAEVDSLTEAVAGEGFLLGCISCKRREEVSARATVDWHFKPQQEEDFRHIFHYDHPAAAVLHEDFSDRLEWQGTLNGDVQIGAVYIQNVTFNDTGTYRCTFHRTLFLPLQLENVVVEKEVELTVVAVANRELTAVISEIVMYVLIVVLQLWLIVVMVHCYRKIWDEHEAREARRALKAQGSLLGSKENCDGVQAE